MKRQITPELFKELNEKVNQYVERNGLFSGGCCYTAYLLADVLTKLGIDYETVMFQDEDIINTRRFRVAINGRGVAHVAIRVKCQGKKHFIGSVKDITWFYSAFPIPHSIRTYRNITAEQILAGYRNNTWNCIYDAAHCNGPLTREIKQIYMKYAEI